MHPICINATRAYMRQISKSPGAVKQMEVEMDTDTATWRKKVVPFIDDGAASRRDARGSVVSQPSALPTAPPPLPFSIMESGFRSEYTDTFDTFLVLNQTRYVSFRMFWDRVPEADAETDFELEHVEQGGEWDDTDTAEERVRVKDNYVQRLGRLTGTGRSAENRQPIDEAEYKRRRIATQMTSIGDIGDEVLAGETDVASNVELSSGSSNQTTRTPQSRILTAQALESQDLHHPFSHHPRSLHLLHPLSDYAPRSPTIVETDSVSTIVGGLGA